MPTPLLLAFALALPQIADDPAAGPPAEAMKPDPTWKPLARDLWFDPARKALIVKTRVCLREGFLEHLLCVSRTKEHEAILATDAPAQAIHAGLLLTGAEPGKPVRFVPDFKPPTGAKIHIEARWLDETATPRTADVRTWIKDQKTEKPLKEDWVFAGSMLLKDPDGKPYYAAESGDLFTVANFTNAILDVPFASSADDTNRNYVADPKNIPPKATVVYLLLTHPKSK